MAQPTVTISSLVTVPPQSWMYYQVTTLKYLFTNL